jgi:hypothetical protein
MSSPAEFSLEAIQEELAPKAAGPKKILVKPKPAGRGKPQFKGTFTSPKAADDDE